MSTESQPFAYGAECRHRVLLDDECQRCKAEETPAADTPTPERVTLSAEERVCLQDSINFYDDEVDDLWPEVEHIIATRLTAREQALREEIATRAPRVELDSALGEPTQCRVWIGGALVFDGLSRDAFLNDPTIARGGAR